MRQRGFAREWRVANENLSNQVLLVSIEHSEDVAPSNRKVAIKCLITSPDGGIESVPIRGYTRKILYHNIHAPLSGRYEISWWFSSTGGWPWHKFSESTFDWLAS